MEDKKETTWSMVVENKQIFNLEIDHKCFIDCGTHGKTIQGPVIITIEKTDNFN